MQLSIIIVNWHSADFVRKCLETLFVRARDLAFEVLVVDNASFDGCATIVENEYPVVKFIQCSTNLGFAKANNRGASEAKGRHLLFLNPDTEIVGDALYRMSSFLDANPQAAIVGCRLLNSDLSLQTSCVQAFPSIVNQALDSEFLRRTFPKLPLWGTRAFLTNGASDVEVIAGACLMIRSDVFKAIGEFSSNYFMYAEDVDLCFKAREAGYRNYYLGDCCVVHHGGRSTEKKPENNFTSIMMRESLLEFMRTRRGKLYAAAYHLSIILTALARLSLLTAAVPFTLSRQNRAALLVAVAKWARVLRWGLGMEAWSRQPA